MVSSTSFAVYLCHILLGARLMLTDFYVTLGVVILVRRLKAVYAVTEEQTGGSLHMHGQLFGMIDQRVLTRWIHDNAFRQEVCNFMDAFATAELPETVLSMSKQQLNPAAVGS